MREVFGSMGPVLVAAALMLGGGCGGDEEKSVTSDGDAPGDDGGSKSSKDAGDAELDSGKGASEFKCGETVCPANSVGLPPCCTAAGAGKAGDPLQFTGVGPNLCGADLSAFLGAPTVVCIQLDQPGELDDSCPDVDSPGGKMAGCCTPAGFCGGMEATIPLGCTYPATGPGQACGSDADDAGTDGG